jgi:hypothetical protein
MEDQPPIFFNRYQHPFGHTSGASEIILTGPIYRLVVGGETSSEQNPPVISPPVVIFRRIGVRAEIRTQNPVLSNTRLAKMVPLSHLRRLCGEHEARFLDSIIRAPPCASQLDCISIKIHSKHYIVRSGELDIYIYIGMYV